MNLKVPGAILSLGCAFLSTGAKIVQGLLQRPFGKLGFLKNLFTKNEFFAIFLKNQHFK